MIIGVDIRVLGTDPHSGIQEYTQQILSRLVSLDTDVTWRLFTAGRRPFIRQPWMDASNVQITDLPMSNRLLWIRTRMTGRPYLDALVGGADVFFFPHFLLGATSPACRRVMTWHDLSYERMPELFSVGRRLWHRFQMQPRQQAQLAHRIIAVSDSTAEDLKSLYGIVPEHITVVPSGVDEELQRSDAGDIERFRTRMGLPRRFILALGTLEPRKNLPALIAAFERLAVRSRFADLELVLAGPEGWLTRPLTNTIAASPVRTRIQLIGSVRQDERALLLSAASVLAYPSLLEGFGFPPLEAMACGTPVVAAANSALAETVGDAGLLIDPYATDRIAAALTAILDDDGLAQMLVRRGHKQRGNFTWDRAALRTMEAIVAA